MILAKDALSTAAPVQKQRDYWNLIENQIMFAANAGHLQTKIVWTEIGVNDFDLQDDIVLSLQSMKYIVEPLRGAIRVIWAEAGE